MQGDSAEGDGENILPAHVRGPRRCHSSIDFVAQTEIGCHIYFGSSGNLWVHAGLAFPYEYYLCGKYLFMKLLKK